MIYRNDALTNLDPTYLHVTLSEKSVRLTAPWPLPDGAPRFLMVHAETLRNRHVLDQTATEAFILPVERDNAAPEQG